MSVGRKRIAHDIRIMRHGMPLSKAIRAISIDYLRKMCRINGLTSNRSPLLQFPTLEVMTNKEEEREEKKRRKRD